MGQCKFKNAKTSELKDEGKLYQILKYLLINTN